MREETGVKGGSIVKRAASLVMIFYFFTVLSCTSSQDQRLIGKWECKKTGDRIELSGNHACTLYSMGFHYSCRWAVSKSDIKIEADQIVLKGSFDDKKIVAEDGAMHYTYVFEKVN